MTAITKRASANLEDFFARVDPLHGRLIFAIDATASRQPTWDLAAGLQAQMFEAAAAIGGLDVQLVHYRGHGECVASRWLSDPRALSSIMSGVLCRAGHTQIRRVLAHARKEHAREKIGALIVISDACEESPIDLYAEARELSGVPVFMFQEGGDDLVTGVYEKIARITNGAVAKFDSNAPQRLADLLKAVAAFAAGGIKALAAQKTEAATLLLNQMRKK